MKKEYLKPDIEYIKFYPDNEITDSNSPEITPGPSGSVGYEDVPGDW